MTHEKFNEKSGVEQRLDEMRLLAANEPKIDQQEIEGRRCHEQFRGNYFQRFPEIQRVRKGEANKDEVFYVRMVKERFGYDLIRYYEENFELCEAICDAVTAKEPYDLLMAEQEEIIMAEQTGQISPDSSRSLHNDVDIHLGLEAIGMYYWDRLNPLLQQAYNIMDQQTLNAPFLTR